MTWAGSPGVASMRFLAGMDPGMSVFPVVMECDTYDLNDHGVGLYEVDDPPARSAATICGLSGHGKRCQRQVWSPGAAVGHGPTLDFAAMCSKEGLINGLLVRHSCEGRNPASSHSTTYRHWIPSLTGPSAVESRRDGEQNQAFPNDTTMDTSPTLFYVMPWRPSLA